MKHRLFSMAVIISILAFFFGVPDGAGVALAMPACDPANVTIAGAEIIVRPTGASDTANLQCAFDVAVANGHATNVRLVSGTYHTAQIVVNGFHGQFTGAGVKKTSVVNQPGLYVTPVDMYLNPPSAANPWPALFAFVNGDFSISNLAIHITGDEPTQGWTIFGIDPPLKELAIAIGILGTEAHVRVDNILVEGEPLADSTFGYTLIQALYFEGWIGEPTPPISGSFSVQNSTFRRMVSTTPVFNLLNATVVISHNTFEDTLYGIDAADLVNSSLEYSHNDVHSTTGFYLYNNILAEDSGSTFLIKNNKFYGESGIVLEATFGEGNDCLVLGNNVQHVTGTGIFLGPGIHGCTVVGGGNKTSIVDLGTDNTIVGVNNRGARVGPTIQNMLKKMRKLH